MLLLLPVRPLPRPTAAKADCCQGRDCCQDECWQLQECSAAKEAAAVLPKLLLPGVS